MAHQVIIQPKKGISLGSVKEILQYRELLFTLALRDIKVRYKQTVIGGLWAIIQPLMTMVIFSFFFGKIAKIPSDGIPYPVFSYSGLILWTYFSGAVSAASNSVIGSAGLISKVYFPRIIIPLASTLVGLLDYMIAGVIVFGLMMYFGYMPSLQITLIPIIIIVSWITASGLGFWFSALNVKYRDVRYVVPFFIQLLMYATPVIYPLSVSGNYKWLVMLNPLSGLMEGHRTMILGHQPIPWEMIGFSAVISLILFTSGIMYFKSVERYLADII